MLHYIQNIKGFIVLVFVWFSLSDSLFSQSSLDLRINEILVINDSNYVDDYGQRSGWIEIFNSAYNTVNMAGMYLTNDPNNPTKYFIPTGDPLTKIPSRNYLVFFADDHPTRGILHLNFKLDESNYLAIYDQSGKVLIDEIYYGSQIPDVSFGRAKDGGNEWIVLEKTTPKANNFTGVIVTAGDNFVIMDPYGIGMALIAMSVVFIALILLYLVFRNIKKLYDFQWSTVFISAKEKAALQENKIEEISGEVNGAIAMALYLYKSELHDNEEAVLTIKKVSRVYSPWNSKIYGLRNYPS